MASGYDIAYSIVSSDVFVIMYTIFIVYKLIRRAWPNHAKGELLFYTRWHRRKFILLIVCIVLLLAYAAVVLESGDFMGSAGRRIISILPVLWLVCLLLPDRVYSNGIEEFSTFYMWQQIDSIEQQDTSNYKVTLNTGRRLYMRLRDGDAFPYMSNLQI